MGFFYATIRNIFKSPNDDPFYDKSPKLLATPSHVAVGQFDIPSGNSTSSSSSSSSLSSSSTFWLSPAPSIWSPRRYIPAQVRKNISKRQAAVLACLLLGLLIWMVPSPQSWRRQVVHINVPHHITNPYQVLKPIAAAAKKHAPDPQHWLEHNSNNKFALSPKSRLVSSISEFGHVSKRPRAALISLVRNSELEGIVQSMTQLEYHWNRKYQYPWIFFNDEPFNDDFKVGHKQGSHDLAANDVRLRPRISPRQRSTMRWCPKTIGPCQIGLMRADS